MHIEIVNTLLNTKQKYYLKKKINYNFDNRAENLFVHF